MIAKILHGPAFERTVGYVLSRTRDHGEAPIIATNMAGRDARELTAEFAGIAGRNRRVRQPVLHVCLRLSPRDERPSDTRFGELAERWLGEMGYARVPYLIVRHPEQHVHIVASRVNYDGRTVDDHREYRRSRARVRALEREYGLEPTRGRERERPRGRERQRGGDAWAS